MQAKAPDTMIFFEGDECGEAIFDCPHLNFDWGLCELFNMDLGSNNDKTDRSAPAYVRCEQCKKWTANKCEKPPRTVTFTITVPDGSDERLIELIEGIAKKEGLAK